MQQVLCFHEENKIVSHRLPKVSRRAVEGSKLPFCGMQRDSHFWIMIIYSNTKICKKPSNAFRYFGHDLSHFGIPHDSFLHLWARVYFEQQLGQHFNCLIRTEILRAELLDIRLFFSEELGVAIDWRRISFGFVGWYGPFQLFNLQILFEYFLMLLIQVFLHFS